ncbi:DUF1749-domain-containing protein [Teratosphaeria destructans]|uniref:DUF1749-domain-containing protein n=1 Tax=Teratosphaeria destructans TaxID=418781 RepID=A0A9W7SMU5_9PEZI|nr:DUF1749-domain-containing protein [Teratosphaeria destructans]
MEGNSSWPAAQGVPGTLHYIPPDLAAFEPTKPLVQSPDTNTLLWIGGMFDTFLSVKYPFEIAKALGSNWSLATTSLSSAGKAWGVSSIARDAEEVGKIVAYFKRQRPNGKVVIMGHSTGCQDCMEYVVGAKADQRPPVNGVILQAPVSDREALEDELPKAHMEEANQLALKMCREGHKDDAMPNRLTRPVFGRLAITAKRWLDVASPGPNHSGADDYFSSDLPDERLKSTFGKLPPTTPLLILEGDADPSIPASVNKDNLVGRWIRATEDGGGKVDRVNGSIVPEATHNLNDNAEPVVRDLVARVVGFLGRLDSGDFSTQGSARM